ncbi:MAG: Ligand-binding SRPBCC domain-containing protein [Chloroflexi bacterium]|jgi:ligand-binding SRPBCC domain-containing protein|nr:MAG: Ligand-binding SRPBCC domain-containing protein [Chloroflexota bacterium]|tara:strand:- start:2264 stop:2743 length:480 start_codon:yes stop_codon:yes gene_type:complete
MYDYKNKILNQKPSFSHSALFDATSDVINDFYFSDGIIKKLKLPLTPIQLLKNEPLNENSLTTMKIWMGPFPIIWEAQHVEVSKENGFTDIQLKGPMKLWIHRHNIIKINDKQCLIEDKIWLEHHQGFKGIFSKLFFSKISLLILFKYRTWITKKEIKI